MDKFWLFIKTVFTDWAALLTGGVVIAGISLYERYTGRSVPFKLYLGVVLFFLFVACYRVYSKVYDAHQMLKEALQTMTTDRGRPQLGLSKEAVHVSEGASGDVQITDVFMLVSVRNMGAPSVAQNFQLELLGDKQPVKAISVRIPESWKIPDTGSGVTAEFNETKDALYEKVDQTPISTGASAAGWLRFQFRGHLIDRFKDPKTKFRLSCHAVDGVEFYTLFDGGAMPLRYIPGVRVPITPTR